MLLKVANDGGGSGRPAGGLLDSPTLARVERAMLRHQEGSQRDAVAQEQARAQYTQEMIAIC
ncbi:unnamed protein product [Acanthoscelides obtectus]|uniref:Uncharacterized protein n=1 Tax=Acanthoscelides obtectus TaxID=200917 RepID=A0A9P0PSG7_ACAOB|nr:unnamed protein product [Acanthoscelides obtectus]CAK1662813.1 hypothetical protein AOBTE_LOCUS23328 [Acanthoscelides obtectus]